MIISPEHGFIFVHVPKTAGSSVAKALAPLERPLPRTLWRSIRRRLPLRDKVDTIYLRKHDPASRAIARLGRETFESYNSFAVVRNPFDHAVSHYEFMKQFRIPAIAEKVAAMPFADYLEYRMKKPFWNDTFFARLPNQSYFLTDTSGALVVDHIVRFETIDQDFPKTMQALGLGHIELPYINKTISRTDKTPVSAYYQDPRAIDRLYQLYGQDFDLLGYDRALPEG